jgi:DNA end-binding protein Ku
VHTIHNNDISQNGLSIDFNPP